MTDNLTIPRCAGCAEVLEQPAYTDPENRWFCADCAIPQLIGERNAARQELAEALGEIGEAPTISDLHRMA